MTHTMSSLTVEVSPEEVDAAAELTLKARVSCSPVLDLRGQALLIKDHSGVMIGSATLVEFNGDINETDGIVLKAPAKLGTHSWSVVCPARLTDGISYEEIAVPFCITVKPHATRIVVWDVPSAVVVGEKFHLKVGLKCSSGCPAAGREFAICDSKGTHVATGAVGSDLWRSSTTLHFAEVEVTAPITEGHHLWQVNVPASAMEIPHEQRSDSFAVRSVPPPDCLVRVEVIDNEERTPLNGASVVMHPYRAVTDDRGMAEIGMARGQYRLQVSRSKHLASSRSIEVTGDVTTRVELDLERVTSPDDRYVW